MASFICYDDEVIHSRHSLLSFILPAAVSFSLSCAKTEDVILPNELTVLTQASKTSSRTAYCYVEFRDVAAPSIPIYLEDDAVILCNDIATSRGGMGYSANFDYDGSGSIRVSIVRPKTGTSAYKSVTVTP